MHFVSGYYFDLYLWQRLPCFQSPIDYQTKNDWSMWSIIMAPNYVCNLNLIINLSIDFGAWIDVQFSMAFKLMFFCVIIVTSVDLLANFLWLPPTHLFAKSFTWVDDECLVRGHPKLDVWDTHALFKYLS